MWWLKKKRAVDHDDAKYPYPVEEKQTDRLQDGIEQLRASGVWMQVGREYEAQRVYMPEPDILDDDGPDEVVFVFRDDGGGEVGEVQVHGDIVWEPATVPVFPRQHHVARWTTTGGVHEEVEGGG